ncbi:MAG: hypothetical protein LBL63_00670, partial [Clostridiales Family XIII bacterium]|nr:hypothetical protein [Clostridiales Family XIII bacterium]
MIDVQNELKTDGAFQIFTEPGSVARRNTPITSMENYRRSFQKKNLWTPVTSEFLLFCPRIIPDYIARGFVVEKHTIDNDREAGGPDLFGAVWEWVPQVQGSMVRPGLPPLLPDIKEWEKHIIFPDPDGFDWAGSLKDNGAYLSEERPTIMWFMNGLFERLISFMSFEDAALALVVKDQKPAVHALLERLCDFYEEIFARYQSYYKANIIYLHDDWG